MVVIYFDGISKDNFFEIISDIIIAINLVNLNYERYLHSNAPLHYDTVGSNEAWLWIAVEPIHRQILGVHISRHRNMIVAESFIRSLIKSYRKHTAVYTDGGLWYPEACIFC